MLKIERIGGVAGFGLPRSKIESTGELAISALSTDDQASVEALFQNPARQQKPGQERDAFRYRITRIVKGQSHSVEVPESAVPLALRGSVSDKLR
jgi:hypothetical protein